MAALQLIEAPPPNAQAAGQLALAEQLLQVLAEEFCALQANDDTALSAIAVTKSGLLKAIDPRVCTRIAGEPRRRFTALMQQAREHNRRNGEHLAAQQTYMRARWSGLRASAGLTAFYSADGISRAGAKFGHA